MWQRIQTLYLLVSTALVIALCLGHACTVEGTAVSYWQIQKPFFGILLGILTGIVVLALLVFKVRILQMRLAVVGAMIALGMQAWLGWLYFTHKEAIFSWTVIFPLVICISNLLAARGCFQDQLMVESAYRVRERRRRK